MGLTTSVPQVPSLLPRKLKQRSHCYSLHTRSLWKYQEDLCRFGIHTYFKGSNTIRNVLVSPKDKDPMVNQSGAIYCFQCSDLSCDEGYIGENSRTFGERYKGHLKDPSPIHQHNNHTGHPTSHNNFQIIWRKGHSLARNIKESIFIRVHTPIKPIIHILISYNKII